MSSSITWFGSHFVFYIKTVCGEDVEVVERFTYLGCEAEVSRRLGRAWGVMDSLDHGVSCCQYLCRRTKV